MRIFYGHALIRCVMIRMGGLSMNASFGSFQRSVLCFVEAYSRAFCAGLGRVFLYKIRLESWCKSLSLACMAKVTAVVNQKGGTGKTTSTLTLAAALCERGKFVLVVDMDPQGNATSGLGATHDPDKGMYAALSGLPVQQAIRQTHVPGLDVLTSGPELSGAAIELVGQERREYRLREVLSEIRTEYDVILIDCPPTLGLLTINALVAADNVLIPVQCEYYALEGIGQLLQTIKLVQTRLQPTLEVLGAMLTMHDKRLRLSQDVVRDMRKHFPYRVFQAVIPRNVRLAEAPSFGKSVFETAPWSKGAKAYRQVAKEYEALL